MITINGIQWESPKPGHIILPVREPSDIRGMVNCKYYDIELKRLQCNINRGIRELAIHEDANRIPMHRSELYEIKDWFKHLDDFCKEDEVELNLIYGHMCRLRGVPDWTSNIIPIMHPLTLKRGADGSFYHDGNWCRIRAFLTGAGCFEDTQHCYDISRRISAYLNDVNKGKCDSTFLGCYLYWGKLNKTAARYEPVGHNPILSHRNFQCDE